MLKINPLRARHGRALAYFVVGLFIFSLAPAYAGWLDFWRKKPCEALLQVAKAEPITYSTANLPEREVPHDLFSMFASFTEGLEPDLLNEDQRILFESYLNTRFGDPRRTSIESKLRLDMNRLYHENPDLRKTVFARAQVSRIEKRYPVPPEVDVYTQRLLKAAGRMKSNLFEVDANVGFWTSLLQLKTEKEDASLSKAELKAQREQRRQALLAELNRFVSAQNRDQLRDPHLPASARVVEVSFALRAVEVDLIARGKSPTDVQLAKLEALNVAGFLDDGIVQGLRSTSAMTRVEAVRNLLRARDTSAMDVGFGGHYDEAVKRLSNSSSIMPANAAVEAQLAEFTRLIENTEPVLLPSETFTVRALSIAESPFRSCLGGSDCSSNTYFNLALDPAFHYFTMTDANGESKGHITVVLGKAGGQPVAFADKIQNVDFARVGPFLESVRQILAREGYLLVFDTLDLGHNGLSNDTSLSKHVFETISLAPKALGPFTLGRDPKFEKGYSRVVANLNVFPMLPLDLGDQTSVTVTDPLPPFSLAGDVSAKKILADTIRLKDGTTEDRIKFLGMAKTLIELQSLSREEYANYTFALIRDPATDLKLKYHALYFWFRDYGHDDIDLCLKTITELPATEALQLYSQLSQRKDMEGISTIHRLAFLGHREKKLLAYLEAQVPYTLVQMLKDSVRRENPFFKNVARVILERLKLISPPDAHGFFDRVSQGQRELTSTPFLADETIGTDRKIALGIWWFQQFNGGFIGAEAFIKALPEAQRGIVRPQLLQRSPKFRALVEYRPSGSCFAAGTKVDTPRGAVDIQDLQLGDTVYSYNHEREAVEVQPIEELFTHADRTLLEVTLDDGTELHVTPEHPFYNPAQGDYAPIGQMFPGDFVLREGAARRIREMRPLPDRAPVYNFEVHQNHNYYVEGVLVHNLKVIM
jgi:hypothetical protein